ncbi:MAG: hypothetical protein NVS2B16_02210 [Chloroflexota bacterium]
MSNALVTQDVSPRETQTLGAEVGRRIRAARLDRGMTLAQVGGNDLSRSFLSLVELGRSRISLRALGIVAQRLDLPMSYFLDEASSSEHGSAELVLDYAEVALARQNPDEALRLVDSAPVSKLLHPRALWLRGGALIALGRARDAIAPLQEGLHLAESRNDAPMCLRLRYRLGLALYSADAYDEASVHLRAVLEADDDEYADPMLLGKAMVCIGHILYVRNQIDSAIQYYARARDTFGTLSDLNNLACTYSGLAMAYDRKGDIPNALRYSKMSLGVFEAQNNGRQAATELNNIAVRYRDLNNFDQAISCANESVTRAHQVGAADVEAAAHSTLAAVYAQTEDFETAQVEAEAAETLAKNTSTLARVDAWIVLAKIAEHRQDHERADGLYTRALEELEKLGHQAAYADAALAYSLVLRERGSTERALEFALQAAQARPAQPA